ncbi:MAG: class II aldolase/adducin family protein [Thaumarchaeota archaeon]|nr:class II aldolase/adducin family protein [Nitrososphaerota archaeon]
MSASVANLRRRIAFACRIAFLEGLHEELGNEYAGHISVRTDNDRILMPGHVHELARGLGEMTSGDIISLDLNGRVVEGKLNPVDEVYIHTHIYQARPEVNSIAHLHPPTATALGSTDAQLLPISLRGSLFADGVPVLKRGPRLIDDHEIADEMVARLGNRKAIIHKGHGVVTVGRNLEEACFLMISLEGAARNQILASHFGKVVPFDEANVSEYAKKVDLSKKTEGWKYYENKWKRFRPD